MDTDIKKNQRSLINYLKNGFEKRDGLNSWELHDFLNFLGNSRDALLYSILYMPELVVLEDSVLLSFSVEDDASKSRFLAACVANETPRAELEASFNFVEVGYLFDAPGRQSSDDEDLLLANLIKHAWSGWLKVSFPEREFCVDTIAPDVTGSSIGVHFYQIRS